MVNLLIFNLIHFFFFEKNNYFNNFNLSLTSCIFTNNFQNDLPFFCKNDEFNLFSINFLKKKKKIIQFYYYFLNNFSISVNRFCFAINKGL